MDRLNLNINKYLGGVLYAFISVSQEKEVNMANWNEADHPRDDIGRFTDKGGGSSSTSTENYERKSQSREDILYPAMKKIGYIIESVYKGNNILTRYF